MSANRNGSTPMYRQRPICVAVQQLIADLEVSSGCFLGQVQITLAGGAAMALYSMTRVSGDVDAIFSTAFCLPETVLFYEDGSRETLSWDRTYSPSLGLMHPDAELDALTVSKSPNNKFDIKVLTPVDLAVSKIRRYADNDKRDIESLYLAGLITADSVRSRAIEALDYYVGDLAQVRHNIQLALESMDCFIPLPPPDPENVVVNTLTDAQRILEGDPTDMPTHCLDNGAISGKLLMLSEDGSVAFIAKKANIVMVYRGDGKKMTWLTVHKGKEVTIKATRNGQQEDSDEPDKEEKQIMH
jgi:hypothetical protein